MKLYRNSDLEFLFDEELTEEYRIPIINIRPAFEENFSSIGFEDDEISDALNERAEQIYSAGEMTENDIRIFLLSKGLKEVE